MPLIGNFFFIDFAKNSQLVAFSKNQGISSIFCPVFVDFTIIQCYADTVDIFGWQISEICPLYWHNLRFSRNFVKKWIFLLSFQLKSLPIARRKRLTWNSGKLLITARAHVNTDFGERIKCLWTLNLSITEVSRALLLLLILCKSRF